jgi:prepilin-type processing-associated H-X9-DG protein
MFGYPELRKATNIPSHDLELFERIGETGIQLTLAGGFNPRLEELSQLYATPERIRYAQEWLTERASIHARHEWRMERVEWAILIFVVVGVFADLYLHGAVFVQSSHPKIPLIGLNLPCPAIPIVSACIFTRNQQEKSRTNVAFCDGSEKVFNLIVRVVWAVPLRHYAIRFRPRQIPVPAATNPVARLRGRECDTAGPVRRHALSV